MPLCIDQSNIPERNAQVTLMALIYRVAHHHHYLPWPGDGGHADTDENDASLSVDATQRAPV